MILSALLAVLSRVASRCDAPRDQPSLELASIQPRHSQQLAGMLKACRKGSLTLKEEPKEGCNNLRCLGARDSNNYPTTIRIASESQTVPEGHKHRSLHPKNLGKCRGPPQNPAEPRRTLEETPAESSERTPQSPLRGKFPRRASLRVVPLGW